MSNTLFHFRVSCFQSRLLTVILLAAFFVSFMPAMSVAQPPTVTISTLNGTVVVSGQAVAVGTVLNMGDTIETQAGAAAVLALSDGSILRLGENTQITLADLTQTPAGARVSWLKLLRGRIRALLSPDHQKAGSAFTIETPNAQVGVKFSQPDVEVSYDPAKQETVGIAHTVELIVINLLTNEKITVPVGTTVIIVGVLLKIAAGTAASVIAAETTTAAAGSTTAGTTAATAAGLGTGTILAIGAGVAAAGGGVAAIAASSGDSGDLGNVMVADGIYTWNFQEQGTTAGCVGNVPGSSGNGPHIGRYSLLVEKTGDSLTGSGNCNDEFFITLEGTVSGTNVQFRRWGPGCTPGFTIDWNYFGTIQGNRITGNFSGGPADIGGDIGVHGAECLTSGTFTVTIQ